MPSTIAMAARRRDRPANFGDYCAAKSSCNIEPLRRMVPQDPLRQTLGVVLMKENHEPLLIGSDAAVMVDSPRRLFGGLKPTYVCRMYYAAHAIRTYLQPS